MYCYFFHRNYRFITSGLLKKYVNVLRQDVEHYRIVHLTAAEVLKDVNLSNKTCLITGANSGIGLEMTRCLTNKDCTVLMACRNTYAAGVVARAVCERTDVIKIFHINLASLSSVKRCSEDILKHIPKLDIVILNVGVFGIPWSLTEDRLETIFQVNYLSHAYLLMNIESILAPDARVVFTSSESHRHVDWPHPYKTLPTKEMVSLPKHDYTSIKAYNISKLCGILYMHNLGYRWLNTGKAVFCAHPGTFVKTGLCTNWWPYETLYNLMKPFSKTISQAASTPIYCAVSPDLNGLTDQYYKNVERCAESDLAQDLHLAFKMNDLTRELLFEHATRREVATTFEEKHADEHYTQRAKDTIDENTLEPDYSS